MAVRRSPGLRRRLSLAASRPRQGMKRVMRCAQGRVRRAIACVLSLLLSACAGAHRDASLPVSDPYEQTNREVMAANQAVLRPVSEAVQAVIPGPVHDRLHDFNSNMKEDPSDFTNTIVVSSSLKSPARLQSSN